MSRHVRPRQDEPNGSNDLGSDSLNRGLGLDSVEVTAASGSTTRYAPKPVIAIFFGIVIRMFYKAHEPRHFHAEHQSQQGKFDFDGSGD